MKTYDEVYEMLVESLLARFRVKREDLKPTTKLRADLKLDSLDIIDLLCEIEDRYGEELVDNDNKELAKRFYTAINGTMQDTANFFLEVINEKEKEKDNV